MSVKQRIAIAALSLSAAGLVTLVDREGYTDTAVIPTKGDRPTVGFGSTFREDGTPVQMGDRTTPQKALARTLAYTAKADTALRACVKVPLHQEEFDLLADHSYQYGVGATCRGPVVRALNVGNYVGACAGYLQYRFAAGYDCATPGNKRCWGVWTRSQERYDKCMAVQ